MNRSSFLFSLLFTACFLIYGEASARKKPQIGCNDPILEAQAEALKKPFLRKGMQIYQEAMLHMSTMEPVPIVVQLQQGLTYELIFVGHENASRLYMELFDGKNRKLEEKRVKGENYIRYSFTPSQTDTYLITIYQKKNTKNMCGYFGLLMPGTGVSQPVKKQAN